MKAKSRKIWSLPLALAVVLMLVGVVSISAVVMAQSTGNRTFTINDMDHFQRTYERVYGSDGITGADVAIVDVGIAAASNPAVAATADVAAVPAVIGLAVTGDDTTNAISGYQVDSSLFEIDPEGVITVRNVMVLNTLTTGDLTDLTEDGPATQRILDKINDPDGPNTFTFAVNVFVDTDTSVDSNLATPVAATGADPEETARNARNGFVLATGASAEANNDLDEVNTLSVTVRILKAKALTEFAAIPGSAYANDLLYGPEGMSRGVSVTGIRSGLNIVPAIVPTDGSPDVDNTISGATAFYASADAQNVVWLKYVENYNYVADAGGDSTNGDISTDGVVAAGNLYARLILTVSVDTNPDRRRRNRSGQGC